MNICSICKEEFEKKPCSAYPVTLDHCCPRCDDLIVTPVRILDAQGYHSVVLQFQTAVETYAVILKQRQRQKHEEDEDQKTKQDKIPGTGLGTDAPDTSGSAR